VETAGFLLVDKPKTWTSHDVVAKVRKLTGIKKVGHGGTLDPMATGLLVLGLGDATKRLEQFVQGDKTYLATIRLGATSNTDDSEGQLTEREVFSAKPDRNRIESVLQKFAGIREQLPPVYSAIKTAGRKAYVEARAGRPVDRKPRLVTIKSVELVRFAWPELEIRTTVSKGTYIRALARDLGEAIGTGGYLAELHRETVGRLSIDDAHRLAEIEVSWSNKLRKVAS
jgi:tRNA pseudouridine55 synthase